MKIKILILLCFALLLSLPLTFAFEFDNVLRTEVSKTKYPDLIVKNSFGLGSDIARLSIIENTELCISNCYAIINVTLHEAGTLPFNFEFTNLRNSRSKILDYNVYTRTEDKKDIDVPIIENVCNSYIEKNDTINPNCSMIQTGTKREEVITYDYKKYFNTVLPAGEYIIKIESKIDEPAFKIDWSFSMLGISAEEIKNYWAVWTNSLNVGLVAYFTFDNATSTTTRTNNSITYNSDLDGTVSGSIYMGHNCLINQCYFYDATSSPLISIINSSKIQPRFNFTVSVWSKPSGAFNGRGIMGRMDNTNRAWIIWHGDGTTNPGNNFEVLSNKFSNQGFSYVTSSGISDSAAWHHIVFRVNDTGRSIFVDGVFKDSDQDFEGIIFNGVTTFGTQAYTGDSDWNGYIDETGFWNRSLSNSEISDLYNGGSGIQWQPDTSPILNITVELNNPLNSAKFNYSNIEFNWSIAPTNVNITNWTLYVWFTNNTFAHVHVNASMNISSNLTVIHNDTLFSDNSYIWNVYACASSDSCSWAQTNRTFQIHTVIPELTRYTPDQIINYSYVGFNLTLNVTVVDSFLESCFFDFNGVRTLSQCNNLTNLTIKSFDNRSLIFYSNDTFGNQNALSINWSYEIFENSRTFNSSVIETSSQSIFVNVTFNNTLYSSIASRLSFNNSEYEMDSSITGSNAIFNTQIDLPLYSGSLPFNFNFTLINSTTYKNVRSYSSNMNLNPFNFSACDSNIPYINFTVYDLETGNKINATFEINFDFRLSDGTIYKNYSKSVSTLANSSFKFCAFPQYISLVTDANMDINSPGYSPNTFYLNNYLLTNSTTEQKLYLTNSSITTITTFRVINNLQQGLQNYNIYIYKYDTGTDTSNLVTILKTNYDGYDIAYLNWYDTLYGFKIYLNTTLIKTIDPYKISTTPQVFKITSETSFPLDKFNDLEYSLSYNNVTKTFLLTFNDPTNQITAGCLRVVKPGIANYSILYDYCENATSGTISYITSETNGTLYGFFYARGSFDPIAMVQATLQIGTTLRDLIGLKEGNLLSLILIGTLAFLGALMGPIACIILTIVGYLLSMGLGLQPNLMTSFIPIILIGLYLIWKGKE